MVSHVLQRDKTMTVNAVLETIIRLVVLVDEVD